MKLHVIIPVYNVENYLRQCVESVLKQPFQELDVVLVDDGSPDRSGAICDELAAQDSRVSVIHQENRGLPGARNSGIEYVLAHGAKDDDYIAFLDSDDIWVPGAVTADIFEKHGTIDVIVFSHYRANTDISRLAPVPLGNANKLFSAGSFSLWTVPVFVWNRFYRVSLFTHTPARFLEAVRYGEDTNFNCVVNYYASSFFCLDRYLVCYRMNPSSIMNTFAKQLLTPFLQQVEGLLSCLDEFHLDDPSYRKQIKDCCCCHLIEMFESYYTSLKFDDKPYRILESHPLCEHFSPEIVRLSAYDNHRLELIVNHKSKFKLLCFVRGLYLHFRQCLKRIKPIYAFYEKKAFPVLFQDIT